MSHYVYKRCILRACLSEGQREVTGVRRGHVMHRLFCLSRKLKKDRCWGGGSSTMLCIHPSLIMPFIHLSYTSGAGIHGESLSLWQLAFKLQFPSGDLCPRMDSARAPSSATLLAGFSVLRFVLLSYVLPLSAIYFVLPWIRNCSLCKSVNDPSLLHSPANDPTHTLITLISVIFSGRLSCSPCFKTSP